jgi:hypothetical protein
MGLGELEMQWGYVNTDVLVKMKKAVGARADARANVEA